MNNLFIKFLPVEGEIKQGDRVWHDEGNYGVVEKIDKHLITVRFEKSFYSVCTLNALTKVLPHLCSRDIKTGDTFFFDNDVPYDSGKTIAATDFCIGYLYKVLGLISPDAVWVEDGIEVKEEDVKSTQMFLSNKEGLMYILWQEPATDGPMLYWCNSVNETGDLEERYIKEWYGRFIQGEDGYATTVYLLRCPTCKTFH